MRSNRAASFRALSVLALALVGVVLVAGISPGATTPLTKQKAKKLFYTKAQADERFAPKGAPASDVACLGCVGENELGFDPATQAELDSTVSVEAWREVGTPGQPPFVPNPNPINCSLPNSQCWANFGAGHNSVAFFKDPFGVVHLKGLVRCLAQGACQENFGIDTKTNFFLPAGYRPAKSEVYPTIGNAANRRLDITPEGAVRLFVAVSTNDFLSLDGITFRAV
jgi:hypothetical protein